MCNLIYRPLFIFSNCFNNCQNHCSTWEILFVLMFDFILISENQIDPLKRLVNVFYLFIANLSFLPYFYLQFSSLNSNRHSKLVDCFYACCYAEQYKAVITILLCFLVFLF